MILWKSVWVIDLGGGLMGEGDKMWYTGFVMIGWKRNAVNMDISACSLCKLKNVDCVISLIHVLMCISYKWCIKKSVHGGNVNKNIFSPLNVNYFHIEISAFTVHFYYSFRVDVER